MNMRLIRAASIFHCVHIVTSMAVIKNGSEDQCVSKPC